MLDLLRRMLPFFAPKAEGKNSFSPSSLSRLMAVPSKTDYKAASDITGAAKGKRVLVLCTELDQMEMKNGKKFMTGNHPVELLVPLLHLENAGAEYDFATPTGKQVAIEQWALPQKDEKVMAFYEAKKEKLEKPLSCASVKDFSAYHAVFIPGGHGAMLGLPNNKDVAKILSGFMENGKFVFAICHGPAAFLSAPKAFKGRTIAAFPDTMDKLTPWLGYLPGNMPWYFGEALKKEGIKILPSAANGVCRQDGNVITGDSPKAAQKFGLMISKALAN